MHNPNHSILKAFTNHLIDLYDDLKRVYPNNVEVRNGRTWVEITKKVNPRLLITGWKEFDHIVPKKALDQKLAPVSRHAPEFVKKKWKVREGGTNQLTPEQYKEISLSPTNTQILSAAENEEKSDKRLHDYKKGIGWGTDMKPQGFEPKKQAQSYHDALVEVAKKTGKRGLMTREEGQAYREITGKEPDSILDAGMGSQFSPPSNKANITGFDVAGEVNKISNATGDFAEHGEHFRKMLDTPVTEEWVIKLFQETVAKKEVKLKSVNYSDNFQTAENLQKAIDENLSEEDKLKQNVNSKAFGALMARFEDELNHGMGLNLYTVYNALTNWSTHVGGVADSYENDKGVIFNNTNKKSKLHNVRLQRQKEVVQVVNSPIWLNQIGATATAA